MPKVFISHSSRDKRFVRTLKDDLNENNIDTWFDEDQLDIGDSLLEKIEESLEDSTHFLIILSPHAINSDWVKLELNKAIRQISKKLINKIIPVQYRECQIPAELKGLLYYDLSKEVVQVAEDKVRFTTDGYPNFLNKIIKSIMSSGEKKLTNMDKVKFREELEESEKMNLVKRELIATLTLQVVVFATSETKTAYIKRVFANSPKIGDKESQIKPILLPRILKNIFKDIPIGHEFIVLSELSEGKTKGYFAGFRRDDLKITMPANLRRDLNIINGPLYMIRFDGNTNEITILSQG